MAENQKKTVILFKSSKISDYWYAKTLSSQNFNALCIAPYRFAYKNLEKLRAKLESPQSYGGIIFSSPRSVEAVSQALLQNPLPSYWKLLRNYAAGEETYYLAYNSFQQLCTIGKSTDSANSLCNLILERFGRERHLPLLLPCGSLARNTLLLRLVAQGFRIDACEVYGNESHPEFTKAIEQAFEDKNVEFLVFFSPISVEIVAAYCQQRGISLQNWKLIALGSKTRRALEDFDLELYGYADRSNVESLIKLLSD